MTHQGTVYPETNNPTRKDGRTAGETIETAGTELKARAGELLEKGKTRANEMLESSKARVGEWKGGFEDGVREKPIQSVLIAVAVGAVIGVLIGRRTS